MKLDALAKRLEILEARIKPRDPTADFLAKLSDEELDLLIAVLTAQEEGREIILTPEQEKNAFDIARHIIETSSLRAQGKENQR